MSVFPEDRGKSVAEPPKEKVVLQFCSACTLSTRPVDETCGRCGKPY